MNARRAGFTFIELVIVILIIGALFVLIGTRSGSFSFWREEGFIRRFAETMQFLHTQAVSDQAFYALRIDLQRNTYEVGVLKTELDDGPGVTNDPTLGNVSYELSTILNPSPGRSVTFIPPPSFPSLAKPVSPPPGMSFVSVKTRRSEDEEPAEFIEVQFSPRGFSDFAVIKMKQFNGAPVTFLVNPFTGLVDIFRDDRDFDWTYGRKAKDTTTP